MAGPGLGGGGGVTKLGGALMASGTERGERRLA